MIIHIFGEDAYRGKRKLEELKKKFLREVDPSGNSIIDIDGEKASLNEIGEAIRPQTLFSRKTMAIISNVFESKDPALFKGLLDVIEGGSGSISDNIIVFYNQISGGERLTKDKAALFKYLSSQKFSQEFKLLSPTDAANWAIAEFENNRARIRTDALRQLISITGNDTWRLSNEITKLISYKTGKQESEQGEISIITSDDVRLLVSGHIEISIFGLTDAIGNKNKALAQNLMEQMLESGLSEIQLLAVIIKQFKSLAMIRQALDLGYSSKKIISELKLHPFAAQKGIIQSRNFSLNSLKEILNSLVLADHDLKTGRKDLRLSLTCIVVNL